MKGIQLQQLVKSPLELRVSSLPDPTPKATEYLIQIRAFALNFFDILQIQGKYQHQPALPWVAGSEFSGVVLHAPPNARYPVGSKVFGAGQGAFAEKICVEEKSIRPVPEGWSFRDAAGLFVTAPTSYAALVRRADLKAGEAVLVHAGAGGVGLAAIMVAKAYGARVIASAGTPEKRQVCLDYGADEVVDYTQSNWVETVNKMTGGRGVDVVYDPVGMVNKSLSCCAWNARVLVVGFAGGKIEEVKVNRVLLKNVSVVGIHWGMYEKKEKEAVEETWQGIFDLIKQKKFRGTVWTGGEEYKGLESVGPAMVALGSRKTWGKVILGVEGEAEARSKL